jgi:Mce-associated membrane protein
MTPAHAKAATGPALDYSEQRTIMPPTNAASEVDTSIAVEEEDADVTGEPNSVPAQDDIDGERATGESVEPVRRWKSFVVYGFLPIVILLLGVVAGYLKYVADGNRESQLARTQSVQAATDGTVALLSYKPDTVDKELGAARNKLTGAFQDSYTKLVNDVVIPGSKQKRITATASIAAATSLSTSADHAVVLLFVDQSITFGTEPASNTSSSVRVTLDKSSDGRWLISQFEPV